MTHQQHVGPVDARTTRPGTMRAVVQDVYGEGEDVLRIEQVDRPAIGDDEVLVAVAAAGVDQGVWHLVAGLPYPVRLAGYGVRAPRNRVPGMDLAGRVVAVGRDVTAFRSGDEVFGTGVGSFAEYARAGHGTLALRPASLPVEQAAAVPVSGVAALQAVRDRGRVQPGQRVLVLGAAGGVGSFAVQIARALGAEVTGVCRTSKVETVRSLGADHVVDHTREDVTASGERYDVIVDTGGQRPLHRLRRILTRHGRLVIVGAETGGRWLGGTDRQLRAMLISPFVSQTLGTFVSKATTADLQALVDLIESGAVRPVVDRTFALDEAAAALRYLRDGRAGGKVVLTV